MSLFSMSFAGGTLILLGSWESLTSNSNSDSDSDSATKTHRFTSITLLSTSFLSLLFISNSILSIFNSFKLNDNLGPALQLQILSISSLFFLFSILGLFNNFSKTLIFPHQFINLVLLFAFIEEFLLFHLQFKDVDGIENRYYDLMLVPILVCVISTIIELKDDKLSELGFNFPKLGRGLGLILQGTWFVQMGFSFFSDLIANNCDLYRKSRGNYTIKCRSHMDLHRGGAIAVLLFNCHLALLVAVICLVYSVVGKQVLARGDFRSYRPISGGGENVGYEGKFSLESESDEGEDGEINVEGDNVGSRSGNGDVELAANGHRAHL